jgi:carnitine 3-dehydrogenase
MRTAVIGTGVIGSGWAARLLAKGHHVAAWDPSPEGEAQLRRAIENAWPALVRIGPVADNWPERLSFPPTLEEAVAGAEFVQESAPEVEELKRELLGRIDRACPAEAVIASSSSGLLPSRIQAGCVRPGRVLVGHPFNPVYLLPLVEIVPGERTEETTVARTMAFYRSLGMRPLHVRNEIEGYISDRLQEALWREALHLVADGIATTAEIDDAIVYGPGLRWAFMGTCLTFHLAGGEGGMAHMLDQFGPALKLPWTKLTAPELTPELRNRMVEQTRAQADGRSVRALERWRDDRLVRILAALEQAEAAEGSMG